VKGVLVYPVEFSEYFDSVLKKLKKKDTSLAVRVLCAVKKISQNPEHYKPLRNAQKPFRFLACRKLKRVFVHILKGKRRKHVGHFVLVFSFENGIIRMENFAHHDDIY